MTKRALFVVITMFMLGWCSYGQVLVYGFTSLATKDVSSNYDYFSVVEEATMNTLYEGNVVSFNERDANQFVLENALYAATSFNCPFIIVWQIEDKRLTMQLFSVTGQKLANEEVAIAVGKNQREGLYSASSKIVAGFVTKIKSLGEG
jgi:hypothetical protein